MKKLQRDITDFGNYRARVLFAGPSSSTDPGPFGEPSFERLTRLACHILRAPVSLIITPERRRYCYQDEAHLPARWTPEARTAVENSWCWSILQTGQAFVLQDRSREERLREERLDRFHPSPQACVSAFAGLPLVTSDGRTLGAVCVLDFCAREWQTRDLHLLRDLADAAVAEIEMRLLLGRLQQRMETSERLVYDMLDALPIGIAIADRTGTILAVNQSWRRAAAYNASRETVGVGANLLDACDRAAIGQDGGDAAAFGTGMRKVVRGELDDFEREYDCVREGATRRFLSRVSRFAQPKPLRLIISQEERRIPTTQARKS